MNSLSQVTLLVSFGDHILHMFSFHIFSIYLGTGKLQCASLAPYSAYYTCIMCCMLFQYICWYGIINMHVDPQIWISDTHACCLLYPFMLYSYHIIDNQYEILQIFYQAHSNSGVVFQIGCIMHAAIITIIYVWMQCHISHMFCFFLLCIMHFLFDIYRWQYRSLHTISWKKSPKPT